MAETLDIKFINPYLQATISIFEMLGIGGGKVGRPALCALEFDETTFLIQVGVTGDMKGQVFFGMTDDKAMHIASVMMMGMPVTELDPMACSALQELGNMILGNSATLFANMGIISDITPPLSLHGKHIKIQTDVPSICIPIIVSGEEFIRIYIAVAEEKNK